MAPLIASFPLLNCVCAWLAACLALLNAGALYFYLSPPGGTRQDLEIESVRVRAQIRAAQTMAAKSHGLASHVQTASEQAAAFSDKYFLPKRTAYVAVFEEIQRMAKESGIQERDAGWSEEPIEGTADLTCSISQPITKALTPI